MYRRGNSAPVKPDKVHFGLAALRVFVTGSVALVRSIAKIASGATDIGQSRLVVPKSGRPGIEPLPSHARPLRDPPEQVPPFTPSLFVASPTHRAHGLSTVVPRYTADASSAVVAASPLSMLAVPVTDPLN